MRELDEKMDSAGINLPTHTHTRYLCDAECTHLAKFRIYWTQIPAEK